MARSRSCSGRVLQVVKPRPAATCRLLSIYSYNVLDLPSRISILGTYTDARRSPCCSCDLSLASPAPHGLALQSALHRNLHPTKVAQSTHGLPHRASPLPAPPAPHRTARTAPHRSIASHRITAPPLLPTAPEPQRYTLARHAAALHSTPTVAMGLIEKLQARTSPAG
jgi:hypothetical protein